ncbi:unnamed protein product [Linum trigynum]|uniref:Uncharacterized protein n=1 Tax=Linum trigynum TaxID=586398 RepID=A0AAV2F2D3_9ROSI
MSKMNPSAVWLAAAAALALLLCTANLPPRCGASTIDALAATQLLASAASAGGAIDDDEFLMESGSSSQSLRMLQAGSQNVYNSITRNQPAYNCGQNRYYCLDNARDRKLYCDPKSRDPACHP